MKTTLKRLGAAAIVLLILGALTAVLRAQTDNQSDTDNPLQPVAFTNTPEGAAFFKLSDYLANGGMLGGPYPFVPDTNGVLYSLNDTAFLVDDASITNNDDLINALLLLAQPQDSFSARIMGGAMTMDIPSPGDPPGTNLPVQWTNSVQYSSIVTDTNGLWIEVPTNSLTTEGQLSIVLHNTIEDEDYDILTTTNLALPLTNWTVEQSVLGSNGDITPLELAVDGWPKLFISARFGGSSDGSGLPDWWELQYFGTNGIDPFTQDPSGDGWNYFDDYQKGFVPGTWHAPPAPTGLTVQYNATSGAASINWLPSPGPVQSYTVKKWTFQTFTHTNVDFSAGTTSFPDSVPTTFDGPFFGNGPLINVTYSIQAHYAGGDSDWSSEVPLQPTYISNDSFNSALSAKMIFGQQNQTYIAINGMPTGTTGIRVTRDARYSDSSYETNIDIPISSLTNGLGLLPPWITSTPIDSDGQDIYVWWLQTLDGNGNPSAPALVFSESTPFFFYDGRRQMKQNLNFLLRAATVVPFNYLAYPSDYPSPTHFSYPSNYVFAGLYQPYAPNSWQDTGFLNIYHPFEENYLFHNFVLNQADLDSNGGLTTGANGNSDSWSYMPYNTFSIPAPRLQYPVTYEFQPPMPPASIPAILDAGSDAQYTYFFPLHTVTDLDKINVTAGSGRYYMTNNTVNFFGLPFESALFVTNNTGFAVLNAGGNIPAVGGFVYPKAALPGLTNVEYYFCEPSFFPDPQSPNLIPGNAAFSVTNTTPLLFASFGQSIQVAGYAKQRLTNGYSDVYAYLGQYFEDALIIDTNGVTTNSAGSISPYGTFLPTNAGPAALVTMSDIDPPYQRGTVVVNVIKLQMDVNHDGIMDLSFGGPDNTSAAHPFAFWINNDMDGGLSPGKDDFDLRSPDFAYTNPQRGNGMPCIHSQRDLEDYARLWICGIPALTNGGYQVKLSWTNVSQGVPAIEIFESAETNGGIGYLTNNTVASTQLVVPGLGQSIGQVADGESFAFPANYFASGMPKYLLFEGAATGSGELVLTIYQDANVIAQTSAWLELRDVKDFYERAVITNTVSGTYSNWISGVESDQFASSPALTEDKELIVFVHGINVAYTDWSIESDTVFKRLYWAGYRGNFTTVKWPCNKLTPIPLPFTTAVFNQSDLKAYKASTAFAAYLTGLHTRFSDERLHLLVHSQGNSMVSEALAQNNLPINTYILTQGAVSDGAYDTNATDDVDLLGAETRGKYTPDWQPWGYRGVYTNIIQRTVNFYNPLDGVLALWVDDQRLLKPSVFFDTSYYAYDIPDGLSHYYPFVGPGYVVTDPQESRAMVARSRSLAVGQSGPAGPSGTIQRAVDLNAQFGFFDSVDEHSAQWTRPIQTSLLYYREVLLRIQPTP